MKEKADMTTKIYHDILGVKEDHENVNEYMRAIIINFDDDRGDILVYNDNFGTNEKYADFTEGKKKAGLHPMQIVFSGVDVARVTHQQYINQDGELCRF